MRYLDKLILDCEVAKATKPVRVFIMQSLDDLNDIKNAIYRIDQVNGSVEAAFDSFKEFRCLNTKYACSKANSASSCMYVGSSRQKLRRRINEHLGNGNKKTYSLHLNKWFVDGNFEITIMQYDDQLDGNVLQLIEDDLANELRPAFGKRGSNNKG